MKCGFPSSLSFLLVVELRLSAECGRLCSPSFVPRCRRALPRSGGAFLPSYPISCFKHFWHRFLRLPILPVWSFSRSLTTFSLKLAGSRSATFYLATALLSARGRASKNRDRTVGHRLGHLCFSWHVWSRCSFLRDLDLFLKLRHVEEFPGCPHFIWDIFPL